MSARVPESAEVVKGLVTSVVPPIAAVFKGAIASPDLSPLGIRLKQFAIRTFMDLCTHFQAAVQPLFEELLAVAVGFTQKLRDLYTAGEVTGADIGTADAGYDSEGDMYGLQALVRRCWSGRGVLV